MRHLRDRVDEDEVEEQLERRRPLLAHRHARLAVGGCARSSPQLHDAQLDRPAPGRRLRAPRALYNWEIGDHVQVRDDPSQLRYELLLDGERVGTILYRRLPGALALVHTDAVSSCASKGRASARASSRARSTTSAHAVCASCRSARSSCSYLDRHPEYRDLVVADADVPGLTAHERDPEADVRHRRDRGAVGAAAVHPHRQLRPRAAAGLRRASPPVGDGRRRRRDRRQPARSRPVPPARCTTGDSTAARRRRRPSPRRSSRGRTGRCSSAAASGSPTPTETSSARTRASRSAAAADPRTSRSATAATGGTASRPRPPAPEPDSIVLGTIVRLKIGRTTPEHGARSHAASNSQPGERDTT